MMRVKFFRFFSSSRKDYYKILGVTPASSKAEIRAAYLKFAKQYHPDSPSGNEEKFKDLGEAWSVLGNEKTKSEYDNFKASGNSGFWNSSNGFSQNPNHSQNFYNWQQNSHQGKSSPFDDFDTFFKDQEKRTKENLNEKKGRNRTQKTEYYEYFDPKTGKRVFYTFKTSFNNKKQEPDQDSFFRDFFQDLNDSNGQNRQNNEKKSGPIDIVLAGIFFFTSIFLISVFAKIIQSKQEYNRRFEGYDDDEDRRYSRKERVWDEFAQEMYERKKNNR